MEVDNLIRVGEEKAIVQFRQSWNSSLYQQTLKSLYATEAQTINSRNIFPIHFVGDKTGKLPIVSPIMNDDDILGENLGVSRDQHLSIKEILYDVKDYGLKFPTDINAINDNAISFFNSKRNFTNLSNNIELNFFRRQMHKMDSLEERTITLEDKFNSSDSDPIDIINQCRLKMVVRPTHIIMSDNVYDAIWINKNTFKKAKVLNGDKNTVLESLLELKIIVLRLPKEKEVIKNNVYFIHKNSNSLYEYNTGSAIIQTPSLSERASSFIQTKEGAIFRWWHEAQFGRQGAIFQQVSLAYDIKIINKETLYVLKDTLSELKKENELPLEEGNN